MTTDGLYQEKTEVGFQVRRQDPMDATATDIDTHLAEVKKYLPVYDGLITNFPNAHIIVTNLVEHDSYVVLEVLA